MAESKTTRTKWAASPGVGGAVKDAVAAVIDKATPTVMKGNARKRSYDDAVNGDARARQSTDSHN